MSLRVQINPKVEEKFREAAMKRFGYGKGALSKAAEEAILKWLSTTEKEPANFEGDPVKAIEGLLRDVDVDSVTLQHETQKVWAKKVLTHLPYWHKHFFRNPSFIQVKKSRTMRGFRFSSPFSGTMRRWRILRAR